MRKITSLFVLLLLVVQASFAQDKHSRIKISNPSEQTLITIASQGIDLSCGTTHEGEDVILEVSEIEMDNLRTNNIYFTVEIDDLTQFYSQRAARDLPIARAQLQAAKVNARATMAQRSSVSNVIMDNIIQYADCDEIDFVEPQNFNLGSMAGCLTFQEMKNELDDMYTYSQNNSLDIVSQKANASPSGQKTWGNPTNNYVNQQNNGPTTYSGIGSTRWDPETIWYVRITGNQSGTPEGTKPQMLFTSMIHSREVSALMNNIYFMWYVIENYGSDPAITELVDNNELYFVPVVNPDGLRWNETVSPGGGGLQRKNLRPNTGGTGTSRGVDLNRNFDYFWGFNNIGSSPLGSNNGANSDYRGPSPESEPETQIMVDFITSRNIKSAVWNHSFANSVPHPYGGIPSQSTGREDEYYKWHEEMTRYNRYLYGATIFYESNGLPDDWMMGGAPDNNGSTGSGQAIIATTPEHGGQGFWPTPSTIVPIAKQSMRISLGTAYYGGKYAKLHDLTQSNITGLTADLDFGIERIGQTASDFTVTVTPISSNIASITSPTTESGMAVLTQRTVTATLNLNASIGDNEKIEYNVKLSNDDGIIYEANYEKYYQPTATITPLFAHDPDASGLIGWTQSGGWTNTTSDAYSGTNSLSTGSYSNNATKTLTTTNSFDFSNSNEVIIQFYTKWDIERNYDFVEVLGSPDGGTNWISLCGNYTKPNATSATTSHDNKSSVYANFQNNSSGQVYDGDRLDNWVMEEITIDSNYLSLLNSNNVKIRFNFRTDALNVNENYTTTNDGFFIDDFKIISVKIPCQTTVPTNLSVSNITTLTAQVDWDEVPSATYDIRYRETGSGPTGWTTITDIVTNSYVISGLTASTDYDVQVSTRCITNTSAYSSTTTFTTAPVVPCTGSNGTITSYPYTEDFDNENPSDPIRWIQGANDVAGSNYEDWTLTSSTTVSANTGPTQDYTSQTTAGTGSYYYTEASNANTTTNVGQNVTITLISPCIDLTGKENAMFSFYYHMTDENFGQMGDLSVDISFDNGSSWNQLNEQGDFVTNDPILQGQQQPTEASDWLQQTIDLSNYSNQTFKLRFAGTTGTGFRSDIAIDQINITADDAGSTPPTAVCQNITVQLDNTGNATIVATDVDGGSTDDVAITNYSIDIDTFDCSNIGTPVNVTLTVTDGDAQTDTCVAVVTVEDQINPIFVNVPSDITLTCGNNQPTFTDPTVTDNCGTGLTPTRTDGTGLNSGDVFPAGTTIISYSADDGNGNTNTASFNVNVIVDNQNPTAVCQNINVQLDGTGNASITAADINNGSSDNCGIASISASQTDFTCADEGANNITLTVTDTNGNTDTCIAVVTIQLQDEPTATNCWDDYQYNSTTCVWENQGSQPTEPTATNCWDDYQFNTTTCTWENQGSQPAEPATACYETATFNETTCQWDVTGTQPTEPTATNCWDDYQFNTTTCAWENQGSQPTEPTATNCWDDYQFNTTTCAWENQGSQPTEPTTECWETATFDNNICAWEVTGTQPTEPTATNCWDDYQFNTTTCAWENQGSQPTEPTTECWETATFDNNTCSWEVTGTQPTEPTETNCWDDYQFNTTTCAWENQGSQPVEPATTCYETATFNETTCQWEVTGTQPTEPTATNCWDDYQFNTTTCAWENQGSQPTEPNATNCWDDYQFNTTNCTWENEGSQPTEPTTECWETATFDNNICAWEVTGTQPIEPTATNCWDDYQFNTTTCAWENQGTEPVEPAATNCWDDYQFNTTTCAWENQGSEPVEPTATNCWDDYQFNTTTCAWENQGSQPTEPTTECWETATFDNNTCAWEVTGTQPIEPTATTCWDDYQFNTTTCVWENQGIQPTAPTGLVANSITSTSAIINWDAITGFDFDLRYRQVGTTIWIDIFDIANNTQTLTPLLPLTQYEVEVRSKCSSSETSNYSTALNFITLDTAINYCTSESTDTSFEFINRVQLNTIDNTSDAQFYSDFTAISTVLRKTQPNTITITPTFLQGGPYNEGYAVWIDLNRDGDFTDADELVWSSDPTNTANVTGVFTIPNTALETKTRMRVSMKWNAVPDPCETFQYGEVEDYTVIIVGTGDLIYRSSAWTPYAPSPVTITENAYVIDGTYTVTDDNQINNMTVCDGAGIVIEKAKSLTVNGNLFTSDNVILESDSDEYASLIVSNSATGKAQYKRHVNTTASSGGNDLIAPPVFGESFIDFRASNPNILSNSTNTLFLFGPFDKATASYVLYTNTESALLDAGKGYRAASTDAGDFTFTGFIKTGNVNAPVVIAGPANPEWNLIGNPYPSYIKLSDFLSLNNSKFTLQRSGVYGYDGNASDGWTIWNQAYSDANPDAKITPGQGFLIAAANTPSQIEFTPSMRTIGNDDDFILGRQNSSSSISHLQLKMYNASKSYHTDFYFTENASLGLDYNYDSGLFGAAPQFSLYSHLVEENQGLNYGIQSIGQTNLSNVIIPLGVNVSAGQQFTISISERTLPENVDVYLQDVETNSFTLLNSTDYTFTPTLDLNSTGRYFLRFSEDTLGTGSNETQAIEVYATTEPRALFVKGQLYEESQLSIFDIQGRLINKRTLNNSQTIHRIDVSSLDSGVYIISLKNSHQDLNVKVVIK